MKRIVFLIISLAMFITSTYANNTSNYSSVGRERELVHEIKKRDPMKFSSLEIREEGGGKFSQYQKPYNMDMQIDTASKKIRLNKNGVQFAVGTLTQGNHKLIDGQLVSSYSGTTIVTQAIDGGFRQTVSITSADANKFYDFPMDLPKDYHLVQDNFKNISIQNKSGSILAQILQPWAKDATGKSINTYYTIEQNNILRQHIDFSETDAFPIIADPAWCGASIASTSWINRSGIWSLSIMPTACGKLWILGAGGFNVNYSWEEVLNMTPSSTHWDKAYGINTYWSMYYQYACHPNTASLLLKFPWNIEPSRPNVGYLATVAALCNP